MFSIFKKKDDLKFYCLGVIIQDKMSNEDVDSCLDMFNNIFKLKSYKQENIDSMSSRLGFTITNYYFFIDSDVWDKKKTLNCSACLVPLKRK